MALAYVGKIAISIVQTVALKPMNDKVMGALTANPVFRPLSDPRMGCVAADPAAARGARGAAVHPE